MDDLTLLIEESGLLFRVMTPSHITEDQKSTGYVIKGVPATILDEENSNGRIYSKSMMAESIAKAKAEGLFSDRRLLCTSNGHPDTTHPDPISASHVITDAFINKDKKSGKNILYCDWKVLGTDNGRNLKALIDDGVTHGTSIRGLGKFNENTKQIEKYQFLGCDSVGAPSAGTFSKNSGVPYEVRYELELG